MRKVFVVANDIKAGDIFSVGQKMSGVINDVGYRAGSLDGMRLVYYNLGTVTPQKNEQLEEKTIKPTAIPVINNDNGKKEVAQKTESNKILIIGGGIVGSLVLLSFFYFIWVWTRSDHGNFK